MKQLGINVKIIDGVDGYSSPYKEEYETYAKIPLFQSGAHPLEKKLGRKTITSPGAWGVLKSYKMILLDALENKYQRILVFEDDLFFIGDFHSRFETFIRDVDDDWKILALGTTQHKWLIPEYLSYREQEIREFDPDQKFYHPLVTDGAFALAYDHSVFQMLIDEIDHMNCPYDSGPVRMVYEKYQKKCFASQPCLVIADVSSSDIREGRNQEEFSTRMKWDLALYNQEKYSELVTIIMPAYNAGKTIEKSIRSILLQTYSNLELIVVDDGSSDNTPKIVEAIAMEDNRVVFQRNDRNRGCYFVRNDALRLSKGKYIAIQDADDISLRNRIEKQLIPLVSGNAFVTFSLFLRSHCKPEELNLEDQEGMKQLVESRRIQVNGKYTYHERYNLALATSVYTREMFEKYGLFWEYRFGSDIEFLERLFFHELGKIFSSADGNAHSFITETKNIPGAFQLLDELLYLSPEMNETNLTRRYEIHGDERKEFFDKFRNRLEGRYDYEYPSF